MGSSIRTYLKDGSYVDWSVVPIKPDKWRPHGIKYRVAWIKDGVRRVLYDNHHGKGDHCHVDDVENDYSFTSVEQLWADFGEAVRKLGGQI